MKIKIGKTEYNVYPGWAAIKKFALAHEPPFQTFTEVIKHFKELDYDNSSFGAWDDIALLMMCFIERGLKIDDSENSLPDIDDIIDWLGIIENMTKAGSLFKDTFGEMSQPENETDEKKQEKQKKNG